MANFLIPFGRDADKRLPTTDERQNGFPCGPADIRLFNGLFNRVESEIGEVIDFAGLTPDDTDFTQLRQAIEALIAAATGGGDTSQFLLVAQARARLPVFPDVQHADGHLGTFTTGPGVLRIPGGRTFLHRGIFPITTVQTDLNTDLSKTYHLRWNPTDGFQLKDLASGTYNPGALAETNEAFDSKFDDMLVARVVTNSSNALTVTNLINKDRYFKSLVKATMETGPSWTGLPRLTDNLNLARRAKFSMPSMSTEATLGTEALVSTYITANRYTLEAFVAGYIVGGGSNQYVSGSMTVEVTL